MAVYDGQVIESRPDWLTITVADEVDRIVLERRAERILLDERAKGDDLRPLTWRGYDGGQTRHARYGQREDSDMLQLSGPLAAEHLGAMVALAHNVTRLDVCVTTKLPGVSDVLIREAYDDGRAHADRQGRNVGYQLLEHSRRGSTLYVGARSSRAFGRLYNKFTESELGYYRDCFRYEVEAKGQLAGHLARDLVAAPDRDARIRSVVYDHFCQRGIAPGFKRGNDDLPLSPYRRRPDDLSRLAWLQRQVAPTLKRLEKRHLLDAGVQALGLTSYMNPLDSGR